MNRELEMTFDPMTIEHLGVRMYSTLPPVLAELIANAYDADASEVKIILNDDGDQKEIIVEDDGVGMSFDEINEQFLTIGRNRREEEGDKVTPKGRKTIGKKGLGKLAFFGIAHEITVTTRKDGHENSFLMSWDKIKASSAAKQYKPDVLKENEACPTEERGTALALSDIQRVSDFDAEAIANSVSKMFIVDPDFKIIIVHNDGEPIEVDNDRKYEGLNKEVEWGVPDDIGMKTEYARHGEIKGKLFATEKPIPPKSNMRGVTLFSRKKLVNLPEYFSDSTSSHFFSYLSGSLEVDFIDDLSEDVIATNRQSLNWGHPDMAELRSHLRSMLNWLEQDWRKKRKEVRERKLTEQTGIDVPDWFSKLPQDVRSKVEPVMQAIVGDSELPPEAASAAARHLHEVIPEYPKYHWRHLHTEIKTASESDYQGGDYYRAFQEAAKRYINAVRTKSSSTNKSSASMMGEVFGSDPNSKLTVVKNFKKTNGDDFENDTVVNIEEGQKYLSMGVVSGCRNPVEHEEVADLRESGLFSEKDCLDALSLLSHLFKRLDDAETLPDEEVE